MGGSLSLTVGTTTVTVPLSATNAQIGSALTRYARSLGISTAGTNAESMTAILEHIRDDIRRRSKDAQLADIEAAQDAANQATVDADNPL